MPGLSPPPDDDAEVFRAAMAGVRRQRANEHVTLDGRRLSTRARQQEADDRAVLDELLAEPADPLESGDTLLYRAPGIQDGVLRKLRRGQFRQDLELDLHGLNRDRARSAVTEFLVHAGAEGARCVRIIHGKGNGSPNSGPVIKRYLDGWLRKRSDVLAFCSARPVDGGTGAVYVLLRSVA